jgi:hypothetical protein
MKRASLLLLIGTAAAAAVGDARIAPFSSGTPGADLPPGWQRYSLGKGQRVTAYSLAQVDGRVVLKANADASVSALVHRLRADPARTPWLAWTWRTEGTLSRADMLSKAGDDYAARVYVLFDYDESRLGLLDRAKIAAARLIYGDPIPVAALCYVWDNRQPEGFSAWSAYTDRLRVIVAESGGTRVGQWVSEAHDVAEDFRRAFGEPAPPISAVIVAVDTDNTGERALSYFGDLALHATRPSDAKEMTKP